MTRRKSLLPAAALTLTQGRNAYFALADEYGSCTDAMLEEPAQNSKLLELEKCIETALNAILQTCPGHIRKLHDAVRSAIDTEEVSKV